MPVDKYNLEEIHYESWNDALDEYNRSKAQLEDISFQTWYEQQISYIEFKKQQIRDKEDKLFIVEENISEAHSLFHILKHIFKDNPNIKIEEEWDAWDEDNQCYYEEEDEDEEDPPF